MAAPQGSRLVRRPRQEPHRAAMRSNSAPPRHAGIFYLRDSRTVLAPSLSISVGKALLGAGLALRQACAGLVLALTAGVAGRTLLGLLARAGRRRREADAAAAVPCS